MMGGKWRGEMSILHNQRDMSLVYTYCKKFLEGNEDREGHNGGSDHVHRILYNKDYRD